MVHNEIFLGQKVTVYGWLQYNRLNSFLVLRDAYGSVQARIPDKRRDLVEKIKVINRESVLKIEGIVAERTEQYRNANMRTGDVEVSFIWRSSLSIFLVLYSFCKKIHSIFTIVYP